MKRGLYISLSSIMRALQPDIAEWAKYKRWEECVRSMADELTALRGFDRDTWLSTVFRS